MDSVNIPDVRNRGGLPLFLYPLTLNVGSFTVDLDREWGSAHVVVGKLHVQDVISRLGGYVVDFNGSIFVILDLDIGLRGTLHGDGQTAVACGEARLRIRTRS